MSPLGVVVSIVLVDLLGFTIVMPLLAPFAKEYGFSGWQIGLLFAAYPMCQLVAGPILGPAERPLRPPAGPDRQPGGDGRLVPDPGPLARLHRDAPGPDARRRLGRQHPGGAGVRGRRDHAREPGAGPRADRHGVRPRVRARAAARRACCSRCRSPRTGGSGCRSWSAAGFSTIAWRPRADPAARVAARPTPRRGRRRGSLSWRGLVETLALPTVGLLVAGRASWSSWPSRRWRGRSASSSASGSAGGPSQAASGSRSSGWSARWSRGA